MIHYHGTRIAASDDQVTRILKSRHACVSYADLSQLSIVQEVCQSWMLDNGPTVSGTQGRPQTGETTTSLSVI